MCKALESGDCVHRREMTRAAERTTTGERHTLALLPSICGLRSFGAQHSLNLPNQGLYRQEFLNKGQPAIGFFNVPWTSSFCKRLTSRACKRERPNKTNAIDPPDSEPRARSCPPLARGRQRLETEAFEARTIAIPHAPLRAAASRGSYNHTGVRRRNGTQIYADFRQLRSVQDGRQRSFCALQPTLCPPHSIPLTCTLSPATRTCTGTHCHPP